MAYMIPPDRPMHGPGHESERLVFDALAEGLPDDYFVYPRLAYVDASRGAYGEADFVILHRTGGFLVVECKGHGVKRDGLVRKLIQKEGFQPDQLTILTPHSRKNSSLRDAQDVGGFPLADHPARRDRAVLHVSIPAFKGLESDVVILADVDPTDARCGRAVR